jgi:hypothetical protein
VARSRVNGVLRGNSLSIVFAMTDPPPDGEASKPKPTADIGRRRVQLRGEARPAAQKGRRPLLAFSLFRRSTPDLVVQPDVAESVRGGTKELSA